MHRSCVCTGGRAGPEAVLLPELCSMHGGMCCQGLQCSLFPASICSVDFCLQKKEKCVFATFFWNSGRSYMSGFNSYLYSKSGV